MEAQTQSTIKNPYKEGTKRFLIAERLLKGETDAGRIASEVGVSRDTVYNVRSELRHIYPESPSISSISSTSSTSPISRAHGELAKGAPPASPPSETVGKPPSEAAGKPIEPIKKPIGTITKPTGEPVNLTNSRVNLTDLTRELTRELADEITRRLADMLKGGTQPGTGAAAPEPAALPPGVAPIGEEVEVRGEKVNYKVALNPEVFYLYNVFKAEAERRGKRWEGDFSDFVYMAAKDVLAVHGIHPAVLSVKGGSLVVKLPVSALETEREEEEGEGEE